MRRKIDINQEKRSFSRWNIEKTRIHLAEKQPQINENEIWWYECGKNVGVEINGKNANFTRPVLIIKKLGRLGFIGLPLTSQNKEGSWYVKFKFNNRDEVAVLAQVKSLSTYRLCRRMGEVRARDGRRIKRKLRQFLG